ncbi:fumarylacetoacetate hydrolase family protein [Aurantimonas sp. VKM B-3413]|uniref:fumarylacetoacetate hydrolase family protein n=1 Tax=Aurantimonas sp. VKM B-3413 TaxID=2779401 RepID=UPI001E4FD3BE|nr:fumarylacetoacetate hydrolase family protein [Aurantimonas sp. VKM B-3413]MCB8836276.1 fumarylacetoacetate hydrolase family protein [Aurantimonas sp. VKM B-3413]
MTSRLLSFIADGKRGYGLAKEGGIVDLSARHGSEWRDLRTAVEAGGIDRLVQVGEGLSPDMGEGDITFDIPVPSAEKIICVGVNFPDRNAEYKDGQTAPPNPSLFPRFARSFVGHNVPLTRPKASEQLDYEGEIVVVIGKSGRHIAERDALSHIVGLSLCDEGTLRDWVRHAKFNVTQGKNFDGSGSIGPWFVPFTGEEQIADIELTTRVNGELRQSDRTSRMIFSFRKIISYISTFTTLVPGDMIVTGTPTGAGARLDPPVWLKPGDTVEVSATGLGTLINGVVDEGEAQSS